MATILRNDENNFSLSETVGQLLNDAQQLFRQEATILRKDVIEDLEKGKDHAKKAVVAGSALALGSLWLVVALTYLLVEAFGLSYWASFGLVGLALCTTGVTLVSSGNSTKENVNGQRNTESRTRSGSYPILDREDSGASRK